MICDYNIVAIYTILSKVIPTPPLPPVIQNDFWMPPTRVVSLIVPLEHLQRCCSSNGVSRCQDIFQAVRERLKGPYHIDKIFDI